MDSAIGVLRREIEARGMANNTVVSLTLTLSCSHSHTLLLTLSHALAHTLACSCSHSHTLLLTLSHALAHTLTLSCSHSLVRLLTCSLTRCSWSRQVIMTTDNGYVMCRPSCCPNTLLLVLHTHSRPPSFLAPCLPPTSPRQTSPGRRAERHCVFDRPHAAAVQGVHLRRRNSRPWAPVPPPLDRLLRPPSWQHQRHHARWRSRCGESAA
jgi:hypothetical protein